jgi:hypothetical protein
MNGAEADAAARLLERLLSDKGYRERFRSYPVAALREAGLPSVAEEMAVGGGKLLNTLDERESRSSLAGVFMAAALEGAAMFDFSREALAHLDELPAPVGNVLSRVNLPAIAEAQAAAPPVQGVEPIGYSPGQSVNAEAGEFPAVTPEQAAAAAARSAQAPEPAAPPPPAAPAEPQPRVSAGARAAAAADSAPSARPAQVDPGQYGAEGSGGSPSPEVQALLRNDKVTFDSNGIADMKAGRMDPRIASVLTAISRDHKITVSAMISDHDRNTSGGSVSNHYYGRAVDIAVVDGQAVNPGNSAAREIAMALSSLPASIRPSEVGSPWALPGTADFSDSAHQNHLHIAYDDAISSSWKPPEELAVPGGAPAGQEVDAVEMPAVTGGSAEDGGDGDDGDDGGDEPGGLEDPGGDTDAEADAESDGDGGGDNNDSVADDPSDEQESDESDSGDDGDHDDSSDSGSDDTDDSDGSDGGEDSGDGSESGDGDGDVGGGADAGGQIDLGDVAGGYPGDNAEKSEVAAWMGAEARKRGLPPELPVMAGLVESGLRNLGGGDADSVGFFQMRVGIWNQGDYAGYPDKAELQLKWFIDQAVAVKQQRIAAGKPVNDPGSYGDWIADVERPAEQYRGRYQLRLEEARGLLRQGAQNQGGGDRGGGQLEPILDGDVGSGAAGPRATAAVAEARKYLGTPYQWGGSSPKTGFDCSGLVQWAYAKAGIQIPRTSEQQILASNGRPVDRRHLIPGDLVFFRDSSGDVHHVGMSLGGDKFINAPHTGDVVKIASLKEPYYAQQFTGGRRFDGAGRAVHAAAAAVGGNGDQGYAPGVDPGAARAAEAALVRDAAEAQRPGTLLFEAVRAEELSNQREAQVLRSFNPGPSS